MRADSESAVLLRLKRVPVFCNLDDASLLQIVRECRHARFRPDMHLFHEGADAPGLHILLTGEVTLHRSLGAGETLAFARRRAGDVLGEISLLDGGPATAGAIATTEVLAAIIRPSDFQRLLAKSPTVALALLRALAGRLRETTELLASAHRDTLRQRLSELLLNDASDDGFIQLPSQRELGERVGGSREAVNRALKDLCRLGGLTRGEKHNQYHVHRGRLSDLAGR